MSMSTNGVYRLCVSVVALALAALGCQRRAGAPVDSAAAARWKSDSTRYVTDSTKWAHDSTVRDSVARSINTDSLYRLYRASLHADNPIQLTGAAQCETARLMLRYGAVLADAAIRRMQDTLIKPGEKADWDRLDARLRGMSAQDNAKLGVSDRKCGPLGPQVDTVNGTALEATTTKPVRPKPPT